MKKIHPKFKGGSTRCNNWKHLSRNDSIFCASVWHWHEKEVLHYSKCHKVEIKGLGVLPREHEIAKRGVAGLCDTNSDISNFDIDKNFLRSIL